MKKLILFTALVAAASAQVSWAGYSNTGECADGVVNACNAKYDGGKALNACVNSGLRQCFKAFPSRPSQTTPARDPRLGAGKLAAAITSSTLACGKDSYIVTTGTSGGGCSFHDYGASYGTVRICQDGTNAGIAWCAKDRPDPCAAPAGHHGKGTCKKQAGTIAGAAPGG